MPTSAYPEITEALLLPRLVRIGPNLHAAVFTLMKLVPARHILLRARNRGELGPDTTIVETTSGTFGLALAMQAALMRRRLIVVSDPVMGPDLRRRLEDLGARVEICERPAEVGGFQEARLRRVAEIRGEHHDTFCPDQYANPENPRSYGVVARHLEQALGRIDCIVGPVGSGGSMCGTVRALREAGADVHAIGIDTHRSVLFGEPDGHRILRGLGMSMMPANLDHRIFDDVHWCSAAEAFGATRALHQEHALFQGPSSGAAYKVAQWWATRHPDAHCVALMPDEGYRYQETAYDDEWLAAGGFDLARTTAQPVRLRAPGAHETPEDRWSWVLWGRRSYEQVVGVPPPARVPSLEPAP